MQSQAPKVYLVTYGCKVNYYESEAVQSNLNAMGIDCAMVSDGAISHLPDAQVFVLNSCAVTSMAEKKSRYGVSKIKRYHPQAQIVTMGCALGRKTPEMVALEVANCLANANYPQPAKLPANGAVVQHKREKAFIKVQDGCQNFCTYCIIPYLRNKIECRPIDDVVAEIRAQGPHVTSVVLCGINLCYYPNFGDLCRAVDACGIAWEISSFEPPMMTPELIKTLGQCAHFVPHFHICLQSGSDAVLRAMNRHYTTAQYAQIIANLRAEFPHAIFGTDLIVGFPTETEQCFAETVAFLKKIDFDTIHIFPYSPRTGTKAAALPQIQNSIVTKRYEDVKKLVKSEQ
ncbi:MAG: MiaB/RimO family radical SAM methylthiotransferase [Eubacteriales bacterium]|nr:MiaB/RimO family radical SAM methylthiotransferase [Eubacteriales bacterium]